MDKDKIFNLFNIQDDKHQSDIKDYQNTTTFKIGMFIKVIKNHKVFHMKLTKFFEKEMESDLIYTESEEFSKLTTYNRAWGYLNGIDLDDESNIDEIISYESNFPNIFPKYLDILIKFYEDREEYIKCAYLFKIFTILKENKEKEENY